MQDEKIDRIARYAERMPEVESDALHDGFVLWELTQRIREQGAELANQFGISRSRFLILQELFHEPGAAMTPADLAVGTRLARTSMTNCLHGLERKGYVVRAPNPRDRRSVLIRLTKEGEAFFTEHMPKHYHFISLIHRALEPEERATVIRALSKILDQLEAFSRDGVEPRHASPGAGHSPS